MKKLIGIFILFCGFHIEGQTLEDYYKIAAENNPGLRAKYKEFEAAMQKIPQANSLADPSFSLGYFIAPTETRLGSQRAKFSLSQMFPWFGTLKAKGEATTLMAEAQYQVFKDAHNKLLFEVAAAYYPLWEFSEKEKIQRNNIDILTSYKKLATIKIEGGSGNMSDVLRINIIMNEANTQLSILQEKEKSLRSLFNTLLNRQYDETIVRSDSLMLNKLPNNFRKDSLNANIPLLDAFDLKIKATDANLRVAQKMGMPHLGFGIDYVVVSKRTDMEIADNGMDMLMPMVTVSLPVFRKKYNAMASEQQLKRQSFELQRKELSNTLQSKYEMIWFEIKSKEKLIDLYERQMIETKQTLNLIYSAYAQTGKDFEDVLRIQQQLLKYQEQKVESLVQYHIALAQLNYLTGKTY